MNSTSIEQRKDQNRWEMEMRWKCGKKQMKWERSQTKNAKEPDE